ncbi:LOW QUALITY PROTEIN: zona pellucida sperm-binding protein 1-like [Betta splendens]|uniref:LOW QUALITY PROTEIN: zona pellucida sperm-binding protein 1-like n=1 Tax=Betta splendens TaxID=158456 RepID=A0A9W2Y4B8_BETSP|nr:LOW QUALITY PROTEIN: zona pellucida sperm-binding protein 1-like [Betta splendens]
MAGLGVRLFVVLAGLLFLDSVWCWELLSSDKQQNLYGPAEWGEHPRSHSDELEYDGYEEIPEDELPERKGEATGDGYSQSSVRHSFPVEGDHFDFDPRPSHPRAQPLLVSFLPTPAASAPAQNCLVSPGEQVTCGQPGISNMQCQTMGCCVNPSTFACYYPLDVCTTDQQFVFAIRASTAAITVDPTKLVIPGTNCKPIIANDQVAIFKFKITECGVRSYRIGTTTIYLARVQSAVNVLDLKYGIITRTDPLSFMIECRYSDKGNSQELLVSTGYMVKTPTSILPSTIMDTGLYAVQLRLATDQTFTSYLPSDHPPLHLLLGKPVYLELNLCPPKPYAVILVNYCLAYPLSGKKCLVLIYEGCANPYDPNVSILKVIDLPKKSPQRRFLVTAFQFMEQKTNLYLNEEIYFMCSTEVCRPTEKTCPNQCFD